MLWFVEKYLLFLQKKSVDSWDQDLQKFKNCTDKSDNSAEISLLCLELFLLQMTYARSFVTFDNYELYTVQQTKEV